MHDVPDQLREWSQSLAESIDPIGIERTKSPMTTPTEAATNRRWLAVAASMIVIVAGIGAVALVRSDDSDRISPATNPTTPTDNIEATTATTELPADSEVAPAPQSTAPTTTDAPTTTTAPTTNPDDRLSSWPTPPGEPAPVDDIATLLPAAPIPSTGLPLRGQADGGSAAQPTFTQVFADADRDILFTLQTTPNSVESTPNEMRQPITIDGWDDAFLTDGSLRLVASDPSGFVRLTGTGIDNDQAASVVASMQRRPDGIPGWDVPTESGLVEINGAWNDSAGQRFVTWFDGDRVVAQMLTSPAHTDLISQALGPIFEQVDVNGKIGWLNADEGRRSIVWSPDGTTTIVVLGVADDRIDPLAVARSVTELDIADYETRTTTEVPAGVGDGCDGSLFC